ncbi:MAG: CheR family methyltransferase, partial [Planctomycetota bacterium]
MDDQECVRFLQWALPRLRMRWPGFRKVRRQVSRRIDRRLRELELADVTAYRTYLQDRAPD